ncbi:MAG: hypothetical protein IJR90_07295 [Clostridia bacterium]|nr:hypothetical protein [Clostridia bacterium]
MICPSCGKTYYNGRSSCPFCGQAAPARSVSPEREAAPSEREAPTEEIDLDRVRRSARATPPRPPAGRPGNYSAHRDVNAATRTYPAARRQPRGPISPPPRRHDGVVSNPAYRPVRPVKRKKSRSSGTGKIILILTAVVLAALAAALLFSFAFRKKDDTAVGREFTEKLISGDVAGAFRLLPYDPEKVYADTLKAELSNEFGGDFEKMSAKYKPMGISAGDIDSFISAAYARITSEFKLGFVTVGSGKYDISVETASSKQYGETEAEAYRRSLKQSFERAGINASDYFDADAVEDVLEVHYTITVTGEDAKTQKGEYLLNLVGINGKTYVIPKNSRLLTSRTGVLGSWSFTEGETVVVVSFTGEGKGSVSSGEKTVPLNYRYVGTDGLSITCAAFGDGETVCTYALSGDTLTLTLSDGIMELKRK